MKHFMKNFILSSLVLTAYSINGALVETKKEQDLYQMVTSIQNFNPKAYDPKAKEKILADMEILRRREGPYWQDPSFQSLEAQLHSFENALYDLDADLRLTLPLPDGDIDKVIASNFMASTKALFPVSTALYVFRDTIAEPERLQLLKDLLPATSFTAEQWQKFFSIIQKVYEHEKKKAHSYEPETYIESILPGLEQAYQKLEAILQDGDTLIGFGNTPQYVLETLKYSKKNIRLIPVALSGHPGYYKSGFKGVGDILTEQGLTNFKKYMQAINLEAKGNHRRIFILDIVGSGGGIEFFIRRLMESYQEAGINIPEIRIIAINELKQSSNYDENTKQFIGKALKVEALSLDLTVLAQELDRMPAVYRVTPDFPAWRWHAWKTDPLQQPVGTHAPLIIEAIKERFAQK